MCLCARACARVFSGRGLVCVIVCPSGSLPRPTDCFLGDLDPVTLLHLVGFLFFLPGVDSYFRPFLVSTRMWGRAGHLSGHKVLTGGGESSLTVQHAEQTLV